MALRLITELNEDIEIITESINESTDEKNYYIVGPFLQAEQKNRNGRKYPLHILEREVDRYNRNYIKENRALGELGHPQNPSVNLERVSHQIVELKRSGNDFIGKALILTEQPHGKMAAGFLKRGIKLGVSSRGVGSLVEDKKDGCLMVQDNYRMMVAADIVADPSAHDAFVNGIMEGKEWIWENGLLKEVDLENARHAINESSRLSSKIEQRKRFEEIFVRTLRNL